MMNQRSALIREPVGRGDVDLAYQRLVVANERIRVLREALADAIVCVQDWSAYVAPYYLEKHDLHGDVKRLRAALDATQ